MNSPKDEISNEELKSFTSAVKNRYGLDFTNYETKSLKRGIGRVITKYKMESMLNLWGRVLRDKEFFISCMDDLTVNLTELFRNPEIWTKLRDEYLESFRNNSKLNIWHAGCSTGEEVYTMAVVLAHKNMLHYTNTLATDLSAKALANAIEAKYSKVLGSKYQKTFDMYREGATLEDIFQVCEKCMTVKPKFKKHITFKQHNLVCDSYPSNQDIIFCRNVMIYFDETLKMNVLKKIHSSLSDNGYFIIGYYDMLPKESEQLFEVVDSKTRAYKKRLL